MKIYRHEDSKLEVHEAFAPLFEQAGLTSFRAVAHLAELEVHRAVPGRKTYRTEIAAAGGPLGAYVKRTWASSLGEKLRRLGPGWHDAAENEWLRLGELAEAGIAAPEPMAFGQRWEHGVVVESVLVMSELTQAQQGDDFFRWLARREAGGALLARKRQALRQIAEFARRFHGLGFRHQDFYLCHFWLRPAGDGYELWLLDHHRTRRVTDRRRPWGRWRVKDMGQLIYSLEPAVFSRTDRLRLLRHYLATGRLSAAQRRFVAAVHRKAARIARHRPRHVFTRSPRTASAAGGAWS